MGTSGLAAHLVRDKILTSADCQTISRDIGGQGASFAKILVAFRIFTEESLAAYIEKKTSLQRLEHDSIMESSPEAVGTIDAPLMTHLEVIPLRIDGKKLIVAMADPLDHSSLEQLRFFTGYKIVPAIATFSSLYKTLATIIPDFEASETSLEKFIKTYQPKRKKRKKERSGAQAAPQEESVSLLTRKSSTYEDDEPIISQQQEEKPSASKEPVFTSPLEDEIEENLSLGSEFDDAPLEEQSVDLDAPLTNEQDFEDPIASEETLAAKEDLALEAIEASESQEAAEEDDPAVLAAYGLTSPEPQEETSHEEEATLSLEELAQEAAQEEQKVEEDPFLANLDKASEEEGLDFEAPALDSEVKDVPIDLDNSPISEDDLALEGSELSDLEGQLEEQIASSAPVSKEDAMTHGIEVFSKNLGQINFVVNEEQLRILIDESCQLLDLRSGAILGESGEDLMVFYQWQDSSDKALTSESLMEQDLKELLAAAVEETWSSCLPLPKALQNWEQGAKEPLIRKVQTSGGSHYFILEWHSDALAQEELGAIAWNFFKKSAAKLSKYAGKAATIR